MDILSIFLAALVALWAFAAIRRLIRHRGSGCCAGVKGCHACKGACGACHSYRSK